MYIRLNASLNCVSIDTFQSIMHDEKFIILCMALIRYAWFARVQTELKEPVCVRALAVLRSSFGFFVLHWRAITLTSLSILFAHWRDFSRSLATVVEFNHRRNQRTPQFDFYSLIRGQCVDVFLATSIAQSMKLSFLRNRRLNSRLARSFIAWYSLLMRR